MMVTWLCCDAPYPLNHSVQTLGLALYIAAQMISQETSPEAPHPATWKKTNHRGVASVRGLYPAPRPRSQGS